LFVIVTVYIDESGTHGPPVTIFGGWVGRLGQWANFDPKWRRLLKQNRLTYFHSKEVRHTQGEFKGWSVAQKQAFMGTAAKLGMKTLEFGFTIFVREDDYQQHYVAGHRPREVPLDSRYGLCFRYCLGLVSNLAMQSFKRRDLEISFVLESGPTNLGDAHRIFGKVKKSQVAHEQEIVRMLKTLTVGDKVDFPGLQIADAVAYSAFQHLTRSPLATTAISPRSDEDYMAAAKRIQRRPIMHLQLGPHELARFRQFILDEVEEKKARRPKVMVPSAADSASQEQSS
jgi:hypothetical protein